MSNRNKRILVVEDSSDTREYIKDILTGHNYVIDTAEDGAQALAKYADFKPDVVTLDLAMPVMDGYETLTRLFNLDKYARVIVFSASENEELQARCLKKGAIGYLVKPFTEQELTTTVANALSIDYNVNIHTFFSLVSSKIEASINKILKDEVSISLSEVTVVRIAGSPQMYSQSYGQYLSSLPSTEPAAKSASNGVKQLTIDSPNSTTGYICEIGDPHSGLIISFISDKDLNTLLEHLKVSTSRISDLEFFNIINQKIISEVSNITLLSLNPRPTRLYDKSRDGKTFLTEVTRGKVQINFRKERIQFEIQLWFELTEALHRRF
jgi:two-component system chemotaxis response regulator CheY